MEHEPTIDSDVNVQPPIELRHDNADIHIDAQRFDAVPEHTGSLADLAQKYGQDGARCPFVDSMGSAGIALVDRLAEAERDPNRGPTIKELRKARQEQKIANQQNRTEASAAPLPKVMPKEKRPEARAKPIAMPRIVVELLHTATPAERPARLSVLPVPECVVIIDTLHIHDAVSREPSVSQSIHQEANVQPIGQRVEYVEPADSRVPFESTNQQPVSYKEIVRSDLAVTAKALTIPTTGDDAARPFNEIVAADIRQLVEPATLAEAKNLAEPATLVARLILLDEVATETTMPSALDTVTGENFEPTAMDSDIKTADDNLTLLAAISDDVPEITQSNTAHVELTEPTGSPEASEPEPVVVAEAPDVIRQITQQVQRRSAEEPALVPELNALVEAITMIRAQALSGLINQPEFMSGIDSHANQPIVLPTEVATYLEVACQRLLDCCNQESNDQAVRQLIQQLLAMQPTATLPTIDMLKNYADLVRNTPERKLFSLDSVKRLATQALPSWSALLGKLALKPIDA